MGDQTVIEQSLESQLTEEPFVNRQVVYCIDSNNGSYNGQIQIDTSSLSNSGRWASYSEGVLVIPFLITIAATSTTAAGSDTESKIISAQDTDFQTARKNFMVGLKNGYYNLIHSLSVEYNNTNVIQLTPYINHYVNYKLLTSLSKSDVDKYGSFLGFYPDGWESADYIGCCKADGDTSTGGSILTTGDPRGRGAVNNRNMPPYGNSIGRFAELTRQNYNEGFHKRCVRCTAFDPKKMTTAGTTTTGAYKSLDSVAPTTSLVTKSTDCNNLGKNYYDHQYTTNNDVFYVLAQIRLKDIADFFDKMPLTRGAYLRFLINTNTSSHTLNYTWATPDTDATDARSNTVYSLSCPSATITGGTSPIMIASGEGQDDYFTSLATQSYVTGVTYVTSPSAGVTTTTGTSALKFTNALGERAQGGNIVNQKTAGSFGGGTATTTTKTWMAQFTIRSSIVTDTTLNRTHPTFSNCRLYVPLYTMTNEEVSRYLSVQPIKNMAYRDVFQYNVDVGANSTFSQLLTNGVANPKTLIVIPYYSSSCNWLSAAPYTISGSSNSGGTTLSEIGSSSVSVNQINATAVWQSPFSSEPGTTSLYAALRDFNVQLSGVNVYSQNVLYDFEMFKNEISRVNAINGGLVDGLTSGLIGYDQWNANMRYYVVDLSRRIKAEDAVPKSIQISGYNQTQVPLTLMIFLEYEKSISIALDSGSLLS